MCMLIKKIYRNIYYFRRRVFESSSNLLSLYTSGVKDEEQWMKRLQMKIQQLPPLTNNIDEVKQQIEPSMVRSFYHSSCSVVLH